MFGPDSLVLDYLKLCYFPDRLAGDAHTQSRDAYLQQIAKLDRHFRAWLALRNLPPRPVAIGDLCDEVVKFAMAREVESPAEGGQGNSPATANKLYRHVKSVWAHAAGSEDAGGPMLVKRICRSKPYREVKREPRAWLPEEIQQIIAAALTMPGLVGDVAPLSGGAPRWTFSGPRPYADVAAADFWSALLLVKLSTGGRISATMQIPTSNWDPQRAQLLVPGEKQKQRADQVFDLLASANDALLKLAPADRGLPTLFADWPFDTDRSWRSLRYHHSILLVRSGLFASPDAATGDDMTAGIESLQQEREIDDKAQELNGGGHAVVHRRRKSKGLAVPR